MSYVPILDFMLSMEITVLYICKKIVYYMYYYHKDISILN